MGHLAVVGGSDGEATFGEDVQAEIAAPFGPFVGLFGEDGTDDADDGVAVGKDSDAVGAATEFSVETFVRVVRPDLGPEPFGEGREREDVGSGGVEVVECRGELAFDVVQETVELGVDGARVGLVIDRVQHRLDRWPHGLGCHGHEVGCVVSAAPVPTGSGQVRRDRLHQALAGVPGDQGDPGESAGDEVGEERIPCRTGL